MYLEVLPKRLSATPDALRERVRPIDCTLPDLCVESVGVCARAPSPTLSPTDPVPRAY